MADYLLQEAATTDKLLKEDGGLFLLENGTGDILLETSGVGGGKFTLENGTGFILLEAGVAPPEVVTGGGIIIPRRRLITRLEREGFEEDEAIALSVLLALRRRSRP